MNTKYKGKYRYTKLLHVCTDGDKVIVLAYNRNNRYTLIESKDEIDYLLNHSSIPIEPMEVKVFKKPNLVKKQFMSSMRLLGSPKSVLSACLVSGREHEKLHEKGLEEYGYKCIRKSNIVKPIGVINKEHYLYALLNPIEYCKRRNEDRPKWLRDFLNKGVEIHGRQDVKDHDQISAMPECFAVEYKEYKDKPRALILYCKKGA